MTDEQIKHMVSRFLCWRLPEDFQPDNGISFRPTFNEEYMASLGKPPMRHDPVGTNLLNYTQAEAMVRHMLEGLPRAWGEPADGASSASTTEPLHRSGMNP
jgi:hypothetical protein